MSTEIEIICNDLELYILSQRTPFICQQVANEWYEQNKKNIRSKKTTVVRYCSTIVQKLQKDEKIKLFDIIRRGDSLPKKIWVVQK